MLGPTWKPVLRPSSWLRMKDLPCRARPLTATTATAKGTCSSNETQGCLNIIQTWSAASQFNNNVDSIAAGPQFVARGRPWRWGWVGRGVTSCSCTWSVDLPQNIQCFGPNFKTFGISAEADQLHRGAGLLGLSVATEPASNHRSWTAASGRTVVYWRTSQATKLDVHIPLIMSQSQDHKPSPEAFRFPGRMLCCVPCTNVISAASRLRNTS